MKLVILSVLGVVGLIPATAGPFRNLGFDEANTNRVILGGQNEGYGSAADLLPDWQLYRGGVLETNLWFNGDPLATRYGAILDEYRPVYAPVPVSGYALLVVGTDSGREPFSLVQRGTIPQGSEFLMLWYWGDLPWSLTLDGIDIPANLAINSGARAIVGLYDVSAFAGRDVELTLTARGGFATGSFDEYFLDSLQFVEVPEPSSGALLATGLLGVATGWGWRRLRRVASLS